MFEGIHYYVNTVFLVMIYYIGFIPEGIDITMT